MLLFYVKLRGISLKNILVFKNEKKIDNSIMYFFMGNILNIYM